MAVLRAIADLQPNAYGVPLRQRMEQEALRVVSYGALYAALERLQEAGLIVTHREPGGPETVRLDAMFAELTEAGRNALADSG